MLTLEKKAFDLSISQDNETGVNTRQMVKVFVICLVAFLLLTSMYNYLGFFNSTPIVQLTPAQLDQVVPATTETPTIEKPIPPETSTSNAKPVPFEHLESSISSDPVKSAGNDQADSESKAETEEKSESR
ncbi:hypothetical protein AAMO2058_001016400 [Amorphochlora amoebiformis]|mmetsp:Transcript_5158/g.7801  ORF Transcript_5158/g.7801 Transcript_5158/m.7801 type:complete len:130 (-) Transcript_5158:108-497(-)